jgi:hypothetical protein
VSFWHPDTFHENDMSEIVREVAGDLAEDVKVRAPRVQLPAHAFYTFLI